MGEYVPLFVALGILLLVGGFLPLMLSGFVDTDTYNQNSFIIPFIDFYQNGISWHIPFISALTGDIEFNFFDLLPNFIQDFLLTQLIVFSYIPDAIAIPLLIFTFICLVYGVVALFLP